MSSPTNSVGAIRRPLSLAGGASEFLETHFDSTYGTFWCFLSSSAPTTFTPRLLSALRAVQCGLEEQARTEIELDVTNRVRFQVFGSRIPGVFSLGGDLGLFQRLIRAKDKAALIRYVRQCVDLVYWTTVNYKLPITTISLVQGRAMGGGLEAALAANVVVAERQSTMGFPEVLFNMFPGMGAYNLLLERLPSKQAERMIQSGKLYQAEELYEMGLVDFLVEEGEGEAAVTQYIRRADKRSRSFYALRQAVDKVRPVTYDDLLRVTEIWIDAAFALDERDLRVMDRISRAQVDS